jgi:uncharacterized protein DUF3558
MSATALLTLAMTAGCTTSEAGQATSGDSPSSTTSTESTSGTSSPSSVEIPPPPRELALDGLDPCTLFTKAQRAQLKTNSVRPVADGGDDIYDGMKECILDADAAEPFITYDVIAVTDVDVDYWINQPHNADVELISIAGYPAAEFHTKGVEDSDCAVAVGVAKNQHLHVEMAPLSEDLKQDEICQGTEQAAEMALQTLQTLK